MNTHHISQRLTLKILLILAFLHSSIVWSQSEPIRIGGLIHLPPYYDERTETGIVIELIKEIFNEVNLKSTINISASNKRGIKLLLNNSIDTLIGNKNDDYYNSFKGIYLSDTYLHFVDCAISLKTSKLSDSKDLSYLKRKSIWAFKGARHALGKTYLNAIKDNPQYTEQVDQLIQYKALMKKRVDVVISDRNIFSTQVYKQAVPISKFSFFSVSETTPRALRFIDKKLRDKFNLGLKKIKKNGVYSKVLLKYNHLYKPNCN